MDRFLSRLPGLEIFLWVLASIVALAALLILVPVFFNVPSTSRQVLAPRPTATSKPPATPTSPPPPPMVRTPSILPTLAPGAETVDFPMTSPLSGWLVSDEKQPHWGDRNLHAGIRNQRTYQALLYFDLSALAPRSEILFAAVELTGVNRGNLGANGTWQLRLLSPDLLADWRGRENSDFQDARVLGSIGAALTPADLEEGQANQFVFAPEQLVWLEEAVNSTARIAFRLDGPSQSPDSLFTWDGGEQGLSAEGHPVLRVIAIPAPFIWITQTPKPQNVITAAAMAAQATDWAQRYGTPTPFPRGYATKEHKVVVTAQPTPANWETATAAAMYATAVAFTTGTFTPTPSNVVVVTSTPTPPFLGLGELTPKPAPTPAAREISRRESVETPIPPEAELRGKIIFRSDREWVGAPQVWVMNRDGTLTGKLTGDVYYRVAETYELFSRDRLSQVDVGKDSRDSWQIVLLDVTKGVLSPLITVRKGIGAYQPAWSPTDNRIVYVSEQTENSEIYVYDFQTGLSTRLTTTPVDPKRGYHPFNRHPSWSPDGKEIIFSSDRNTDPPRFQIWIMDANGGNLRVLSPSLYNDQDPIWVKK